MLRKIRAEAGSILRNVSVDRLLIVCFVSDAISMLGGAGECRPHESAGGEQLDDVTPHVRLVRGYQIRTNERGHLVSDH